MTKKTQKLRKVLTLAACAVLLVSVTIVGTVAYLTSQDEVTNTFTVGNIAITLDELDVDNSTEGENDRDKANEYHLLPNQTYIKDPTIHVAANSEDSYLFIKVVNDIADIEAGSVEGGYQNIEDQIEANGWKPVADEEGVYYKTYAKQATVKDEIIFANFKIADDVANDTLATYGTADTTIEITAYAIQSAGFNNEVEAWNVVYAEYNN